MTKWTAFWLDTIEFYGLVLSRDSWQKIIKENFGGNIKKPKGLKFSPLSEYPDFGEGAKYSDPLTLGQWANSQGMDLTID